MSRQRFDTVVVGGGQSGLAVGYHLARRGRSFVILDEHARVGDAWRSRWDSLRLFTNAWAVGLPGMRYPGPRLAFPTKDEFADYLESYAMRWDLPVRTGARVTRVHAGDGGRFVVTVGEDELEADHVIVTTGANHTPRVPALAADLDPRLAQLHSSGYRRPTDVPVGPVLVVGTGNSGAELAAELARTRPVLLAGPDPDQIPTRLTTATSAVVLPIVQLVHRHVLTLRTPMGRRAAAQHRTVPLIRTRTVDLDAAGVERVPRVVGTQDGLPLLEDGRVVDVGAVVWCTGYRTDLPWLELPACDADGRVLHDRGLSTTVPGLAFAGLHFQFALASETVPGVGRDAAWVVRHLDAHGRVPTTEARSVSRAA
ncbi:flavin-containing monooxygenase [Cellulomonas sp. ICMP 17802]|uniref:flavin-containing monooxygenase n=1 Tax=Cellulomonas sp. ICMP 17802 TaxID=3239199 RepID=UPI00351B1FC4